MQSPTISVETGPICFAYYELIKEDNHHNRSSHKIMIDSNDSETVTPDIMDKNFTVEITLVYYYGFFPPLFM